MRLLALLALTACGSAHSQPTTSCADQVAGLRGYVEALAVDSMPRLELRRDLRLVEDRRSAPLVRERGNVLAVDAHGQLFLNTSRFTYSDEAYESYDSFASREAARDFQSDLSITGRGPVLYLAADRDAPWKSVVGAVEIARDAGFTRVGILMARRPTAPPPGPSFLDAQIGDRRGLDTIGPLVAPQLALCPAADRLLGRALLEDDPHLFARIPDEVGACGCSMDGAVFRKVLWLAMTSNGPPRSVVFIAPAAADLETARIDLDKAVLAAPGAPWGTVAEQLLDKAGRAAAPVSLELGVLRPPPPPAAPPPPLRRRRPAGEAPPAGK